MTLPEHGDIYFGNLESIDHRVYERHHPTHGNVTTWLRPKARYTYGLRFRDVHIHFGPRTIVFKSLNTRLFEIGRDLTNHLVLLDPQSLISRRHGVFFIRNGHVTFEDHSLSGTWIADGSLCHYAIRPINAYPTRLQLGTVLLSASVNRWGDLHIDLLLPEHMAAICRVEPISDNGYVLYGDMKLECQKFIHPPLYRASSPESILPAVDPLWERKEDFVIFDNASRWDQLVYHFIHRDFSSIWKCFHQEEQERYGAVQLTDLHQEALNISRLQIS